MEDKQTMATEEKNLELTDAELAKVTGGKTNPRQIPIIVTKVYEAENYPGQIKINIIREQRVQGLIERDALDNMK